MRLREFGLLTDENIDPDVTGFLRAQGFDVADVAEMQLGGSADAELLRRALLESRIVVTHDSDFGTLAIRSAEPIVGILYLRPGHIQPAFTIGTIEALLAADPQLTPPVLIVARRTVNSVSIRVRNLK